MNSTFDVLFVKNLRNPVLSHEPRSLPLSSSHFYFWNRSVLSSIAFPSRGLLLRAGGIWAHVSLFVSDVFSERLMRADIT